MYIMTTRDARIPRGTPRSLVPPETSPFEAVPGPKTDVGRLASGAEKVRSAHHHHAHVTGGPRATRRAGSVGRTAGTCPDAPPRRGHPRDHNRVPRHVVVGSETAYGRQLLGERFRPPAVAVGRQSVEARAWKACASPPPRIARPELRQGVVSALRPAVCRLAALRDRYRPIDRLAQLWHDQPVGSQRAQGRSASGFSLRPDAPITSAPSAARTAPAGRRRPR